MYLDTNNEYNRLRNARYFPMGREMPIYFPNETFIESPYFIDYYIGNFGTVIDKRTGLQVNHRFSTTGYIVMSMRFIDLIIGEAKYDTVKLHRVIMIAFDPIPDAYAKHVNHKDGIKHHNVYLPGTPWNNLEWSTAGENNRHAVINNLRKTKRPPEYQTSYMSDQDVHMICSMFEKGYSIDEVIDGMGMERNAASRKRVTNIKDGHARKDISSQYRMPELKKTMHHTEEDVRIILSLLQDMKRQGYSNNAIAIYRLKNEYGLDITNGFIQNLRGRSIQKWNHIVDEYDI